MYLEKIRKLSEKRNGGLKKLAIDIGMSEQNIHRCINNNKIQAGDLEKIAALLNVPISYFFDDTPASAAHANGTGSVAAVNSEVSVGTNLSDGERIEYLEKLLDEKERTIQILMKK